MSEQRACDLCGGMAEVKPEVVRCPHCRIAYKISDKAKLFYFDQVRLGNKEKRLLIDYLKKNSSYEDDSMPVPLLTSEKIAHITNVLSGSNRNK